MNIDETLQNQIKSSLVEMYVEGAIKTLDSLIGFFKETTVELTNVETIALLELAKEKVLENGN